MKHRLKNALVLMGSIFLIALGIMAWQVSFTRNCTIERLAALLPFATCMFLSCIILHAFLGGSRLSNWNKCAKSTEVVLLHEHATHIYPMPSSITKAFVCR